MMDLDIGAIIKEADEGLLKLRELAEKAGEWHNARMAVSSMSIKDEGYMNALNRLYEAEDALSRLFTSP